MCAPRRANVTIYYPCVLMCKKIVVLNFSVNVLIVYTVMSIDI